MSIAPVSLYTDTIIPDWIKSILLNHGEGRHFFHTALGLMLVHFVDNPTAYLIDIIQNGHYDFLLVDQDLHTAFLLYRIHPGLDWFRLPHAIGRVDPILRDRRPLGFREQYRLHSILIDNTNGAIKAVRKIKLSISFSAELSHINQKQRRAVSIFTQRAYQQTLASIADQWPNPADMIGEAIAHDQSDDVME